MPTTVEPNVHREPWRIPYWLGLCVFLAIAAFFLWEEHRAHLLGALPYVLFLRGYLREHWAVLRHAPIRDPVLGVLALIEKWGVDAQASPEPVTQQVKRERIRGRTLRGQDAHPRRTV